MTRTSETVKSFSDELSLVGGKIYIKVVIKKLRIFGNF